MLVVGPPFGTYPLKNVMAKEEVCVRCLFSLFLFVYIFYIVLKMKSAFFLQAPSNFLCCVSMGSITCICNIVV